MHQKVGALPTYLALGLAALAAIMSASPHRPDIDGAVLYLLTATANALEMAQPDPEQPEQFTSP